MTAASLTQIRSPHPVHPVHEGMMISGGVTESEKLTKMSVCEWAGHQGLLALALPLIPVQVVVALTLLVVQSRRLH